MVNDPNEWTNLVEDPAHDAVIAQHRKWIPEVQLDPAPGSAHRVLTYDPASDEAIWEGTVVRRGDPITE